MNKWETDIILLACKKHGIFLTMRKEGNLYLVKLVNRIEIKSFEAAKFSTNGFVVEGRVRIIGKKHIDELETNAKLNFTNYPTRMNRSDSGVDWGSRVRL